jgi:hypothetical protein
LEPSATGISYGFWSAFDLIPCADGKARRAQPVFQLISDGLSEIMGRDWNPLCSQVEKEVRRHATQADAGPGEVLRAMWEAAAQETLRANSGGHDAVQGAAVLLVALCELARRVGAVFNLTASDIGQIEEATMRTLWALAAAPAAPRPPHQRRLEGPPPREPSDALHRVPPGQDAQQEAAEGMPGVRQCGAEARHVPEALSALEKVWRSVVDESPQEGRAERLHTGLGVILASQGFPLTTSVPGRVGLLRGAGNAIVPQVAALFVRAFLEAEEGLVEAG